jgi:hypothetical protein
VGEGWDAGMVGWREVGGIFEVARTLWHGLGAFGRRGEAGSMEEWWEG